jgi:putative Ca2+/H+ antiporter (TMEM165/GDT1 family)
MIAMEFLRVAVLVFLAELADKTQLTVLGLSTGSRSRVTVFLASSLALIVSTLLAVLAGDLISRWVPPTILESSVGVLFIGLGLWFLYGALK